MQHHAQYATSKADGDVPFLLWFHMMLMHPDQCHLFSKHGGDDVLLNLISDVERDRRFALTVDPNVIVNTICRGSGNGIICFNIELFNNQLGDFEFYCGLWNPATRDFKIVAFPKAPDQLLPRCSCVVGFMYDALCNDFKIMARTCIVSDSDSPYINLAYDIFSLSTNSWKRLSNQPIYSGARGPGLAIVSPSTMDAFVNGVYYWIADLSNDDETKDYILSFQLSTETFKLSDLPQGIAQPMNMNIDQLFGREIGLYKESLAIYVTQNPEQQVGHVEIWVVTEFD
ncbi:putative F-box protein At3g16210 [Chenopodium quinoa]|uniref:putative F-box protein At3g16210 n=1 Tax=Chenopodium quinoa TaxID=63459 RepID=UPI000B78FE85|nr:putative F-box protein At3g16210 [Chenopodium quinoa]